VLQIDLASPKEVLQIDLTSPKESWREKSSEIFFKEETCLCSSGNANQWLKTPYVDETEEISRLQKRLSNQITENVWREKESVRLQEQIKRLQERNLVSPRHLIRLKRANVATSKGGNSLEISITESEIDQDPKDTNWMQLLPAINNKCSNYLPHSRMNAADKMNTLSY
jgi:hypothetical protein